MRVIETKVYKYEELTESAKENAIERLSDINVDYEWWDSAYEDAERIGLKLTEFDTGRGNFCKGELVEDIETVADLIIEQHGESCETYQDAIQYKKERGDLVKSYSNGIDINTVTEENEDDFDDDCDDLDADFLKSLLEDYRIILSKEYDYLTGEEAIKETIQANEYEFTEGGKLI